MAFPDRDEPESLFYRTDLEEFRNIWLREHPGQFPDQNCLCGSWSIDDWPEYINEAVMIVEFKTVRICVRATDKEKIKFVP